MRKSDERREYREFVQAKVDSARKSMEAGHGYSSEEIEAEFAALCVAATRRS